MQSHKFYQRNLNLINLDLVQLKKLLRKLMYLRKLNSNQFPSLYSVIYHEEVCLFN